MIIKFIYTICPDVNILNSSHVYKKKKYVFAFCLGHETKIY